jgi:hypothetical protein
MNGAPGIYSRFETRPQRLKHDFREAVYITSKKPRPKANGTANHDNTRHSHYGKKSHEWGTRFSAIRPAWLWPALARLGRGTRRILVDCAVEPGHFGARA